MPYNFRILISFFFIFILKYNKTNFKGTYATVYKGYSLVSKQLVALKRIRMKKSEGAPCTAIREISLLRGLNHANIVKLHDVIYEAGSLTLVFEYGVSCFLSFLLFHSVFNNCDKQ